MNTPPTSSSTTGSHPPPPKSTSSGCLKAAGIGCGALFLLALVGVFFLVRSVKHEYAHPHRGGLFGTIIIGAQASQDGRKIQQAIVAYRRAHGKYPDTLPQLVADGMIDGKLLHNDLDPNPSPASISWQYVKPGPSTPPDGDLLIEKFQMPVPGAKSQIATGYVVIDLNGNVKNNASSKGGMSPAFPHSP